MAKILKTPNGKIIGNLMAGQGHYLVPTSSISAVSVNCNTTDLSVAAAIEKLKSAYPTMGSSGLVFLYANDDFSDFIMLQAQHDNTTEEIEQYSITFQSSTGGTPVTLTLTNDTSMAEGPGWYNGLTKVNTVQTFQFGKSVTGLASMEGEPIGQYNNLLSRVVNDDPTFPGQGPATFKVIQG